VEMLRMFAGHPDEVFSLDYLLTRFWGADFDGGDHAFHMALHRLREKLAGAAVHLKTVRGSGYVFRL